MYGNGRGVARGEDNEAGLTRKKGGGVVAAMEGGGRVGTVQATGLVDEEEEEVYGAGM